MKATTQKKLMAGLAIITIIGLLFSIIMPLAATLNY